MSRLTTAFVLLALLPLSAGGAAPSEPAAMPDPGPYHRTPATARKPAAGVVMLPLRAAPKMTHLPASLIAAKTTPLPDGNVEFCAGPGHQ